MTPLQLPKIDPSLDITSPPLTCLDTGTIWSQPGNFYTQIVDLADIDNSRAMIAPGNCEDGMSPLRTAGVDLWVQGRTRPAPLARAKVEQLGVTKTSAPVQAYAGPTASPTLTVDKPEPTWQFVPAIPPSTPESKDPPRPSPAAAQKPDDPKLEAAFRRILHRDTPPQEIDAALAECREYVKGNAGLTAQLRGAAILGDEGINALRQTQDEVAKVGTASELAGAKTEGFSGKLENFKKANALAIALGTPLLGPLGSFIDLLAGKVQTVTDFTEAVTNLGKSINELPNKILGGQSLSDLFGGPIVLSTRNSQTT